MTKRESEVSFRLGRKGWKGGSFGNLTAISLLPTRALPREMVRRWGRWADDTAHLKSGRDKARNITRSVLQHPAARTLNIPYLASPPPNHQSVSSLSFSRARCSRGACSKVGDWASKSWWEGSIPSAPARTPAGKEKINRRILTFL